MLFRVGPAYASVEDFTDTEIDGLMSALTVGYKYWRRIRGKPYPEEVHRDICFVRKSDSGVPIIPSGFLPVRTDSRTGVLAEDPTRDRHVCVYSIPPGYCGPLPSFDTNPIDHHRIPPELGGWKFRDYQIGAMLAAVRCERGILSLPTGSGKSAVMAGIIQSINLPALILVPNLDLLEQTADVMQEAVGHLGDVTIIGGGSKEIGFVTVATPGSLANLFVDRAIDRWLVVMADECHHINLAGQAQDTTLWYKLLMSCTAPYRFGLSGTVPPRSNAARWLLEGATGPIIYEISTSKLIEEGYLSPAVIEMVGMFHSPRISRWVEAREVHLFGDARNRKVVDAARREAGVGKSVLVLVDLKSKHGQVLADMMPEAFYVTGDTPVEERVDVVRRFKGGFGADAGVPSATSGQGDPKEARLVGQCGVANGAVGPILIGTVFGEGIDIPSLDVVVMASGGKSHRLTVQRVGRALRKAAGKDKAKIIDFIDDDGGVLLRHSKARLETYLSEPAFEVTGDVEGYGVRRTKRKGNTGG